MTDVKSVNPRELVLDILLEINKNEEYSHIALNHTLEKYQYLSKQDRAFITRVTEGTLENQILIDYIINQFSKVKVNKLKPLIRNLIRSSVYQLKFMDSIPDSAVCNEAVKLAGKRGFSNLKGFVNGVLRNISREQDKIQYPIREKDPAKYLSVTYSMPDWIIESWSKEYDYEMIEKMLKAFLVDGKTSIRCNKKRTTVEELMNRLREENIEVVPSPYLSYAFEISGYDFLNKVAAFREGLFQVQDVSSMLVAEIAAPKENDYVIDVCAAPGGKSLHIADMMNQKGQVEARDLTEYKVAMIEDNIRRNQATNMKAVCMDALIKDEESVGKADIVIADLPCSGLGVLRKKTDIKYKMTSQKQADLVLLQRKILSVIESYVKEDGILIYSTCTINKEENLGNVQWFTENFSFDLETISPYLCKELQSETTEKGYLQLLPGIHETDGFFIARLRRRKQDE